MLEMNHSFGMVDTMAANGVNLDALIAKEMENPDGTS